MFRFSEEQISKYEGVNPPWGALGHVVYKRTYSRPIQDENGHMIDRETWLQTCVRVIEGNINLIPDDPTATEEWAVEALDLMFNMAWLPPGRGLWVMGTEYAEKRGGDALNNCWYVSIKPNSYENMKMFEGTYLYSDPIKPMPSFPFVFMFDRSMLGGGVGFSVSQENMESFPEVDTKVNVSIVMDDTHSDISRIPNALKDFITVAKEGDVYPKDNDVIMVEDSREGWAIAVRELIDTHFSGYDDINLVFDVSNIRGYGEDIKGFGGTASGPLSLVEALLDINKILNHSLGKKLKSTDGLDIMNLLGRCVVSGNVRRSALLGLGDPTDEEYVNAKNYKKILPVLELDKSGYPVMEDDGAGGKKQKRKDYNECTLELGKEKTDELLDLAWRMENHRWASNNSVLVDNLFDDFHFVASGMIANGEPGMVNLWLCQNYGRIIDGFKEGIDSGVLGVNPCAEVTLEDGENCNLVEFLPYICYKLGVSIERAIEISTQYSYRITFAKYEWPITQKVVARNRRIGVSFDGIQDYYLAKYGHYALKEFEGGDITKPVFHQEMVDELNHWYDLVDKTNKEHARLLGSTPSIKMTTVKPSGSISKLPGVSAGIHWHYSPYLIQRIRFHETDPNLMVLRKCGYNIESDYQTPNTKVVEFPIKSPNADNPNFRGAGDVSIEEQMANQYLFAYAWADNAVSATITFQLEEHHKIEPLLRAYRDKLKSTSLLPYSGHGYKQAPWEPISKEKYEKMNASISMDINEAYRLVKIIEEKDILLDESCAKGICPIR